MLLLFPPHTDPGVLPTLARFHRSTLSNSLERHMRSRSVRALGSEYVEELRRFGQNMEVKISQPDAQLDVLPSHPLKRIVPSPVGSYHPGHHPVNRDEV